MGVLDAIRGIFWAYTVFWAGYVLGLPIYSKLRPRARPPILRHGEPSVVIIVPIRNMASSIERCIRSIKESTGAVRNVRIFVVADHCDDDTAERAERAGAEVLVRNDGPPGKTYTLSWTFRTFAETGVKADLYVVVDATAEIDSRFLPAMIDMWRHGEDIVVSHPAVDPANKRWFARSLGLMLAHRNIQNRSRERLRLSALIEGRGMAYSSSYIDRHGWSLAVPEAHVQGTHPTEDWRHAVRAAEHGHRVAFADDARVFTALRDSLVAATKQGIRWERGRVANAGTYALRLLLIGLRRKSRLMTLAALDAIQPPVAILGALSMAAALWTAAAASTAAGVAIGFLPVLLLVLYTPAVVTQAARDGISPATLLWAPAYIAWRCIAFALAWLFLGRFRGRRGASSPGKESLTSSN